MFRFCVCNTELEVPLTCIDDVSPCSLFILALECIVNPSNVETLTLDVGHRPQFRELDWTASLGGMPNVVKLGMNLDVSGCMLLHALTRVPGTPECPMILPKLREIFISVQDKDLLEGWGCLKAMLCAREGFGAKILVVKLKTRGMDVIRPPAAQMELVASYVDRFEWV